jgi:hypothetical protein
VAQRGAQVFVVRQIVATRGPAHVNPPAGR